MPPVIPSDPRVVSMATPADMYSMDPASARSLWPGRRDTSSTCASPPDTAEEASKSIGAESG